MKRKVSGAQAAAAALLMGCAAPASAAVVVNGGAPDQIETGPAQSPDMAAMNFFLATGETTVGGAVWWGACDALICGPVSFEVSFYNTTIDGLNLPDMLVPGGPIDVGEANATATGGEIGGAPEYKYTATFPTPVTVLAAGTEYWFAVTETLPGTGWGLESTSDMPDGVRGAVFDGSSWAPPLGDNAFAFELTDGAASLPAAPELPTWTMMGLGFAALGFVSRRQARRCAALG